MCIRDSHGHLVDGLGAPDDRVGGVEHLDAQGEAPLDQVAPVSYTHLRAHETVLDLVCRLLLEKKKNININITYTRTQHKQHIALHTKQKQHQTREHQSNQQQS